VTPTVESSKPAVVSPPVPVKTGSQLPSLMYVNGRPSLVCQVPLNKLSRTPALPTVKVEGKPPSSSKRTAEPLVNEQSTNINTSSKSSKQRRSSVSDTVSSSTVLPTIESTPAHRKESKRKRKNEVVAEETEETKLSKRSRRKGIENQAGPFDAVAPTPTHDLVPTKSPAPYEPTMYQRTSSPPSLYNHQILQRQQQSSSASNVVYFSYFEEPLAHQLEQEDRDHNHFLSEAKALKHAADRQVQVLSY
jgi:hypothetical protein